MKIDWLDTFILFGIIQAAMLILMIVVKKQYNAHRAFIWILIILSLMQLESFLLRSGYFESFIHFCNISRPLIFLVGPLILLYVHNLLGRKWKLIHGILHTVPFLFYLGYSFNFFLQPWQVKYNVVVSDYHRELERISSIQSFEADPWNIQGLIVVELITVHLLMYSLAALYEARRKKQYFEGTNPNHTKWLSYLCYLFIFGGLALFFSQGGVINGVTFLKSPFPSYSVDLVSTFSIYLFMLYLIIWPSTLIPSKKKYKTSSLPTNYKKQKLSSLIELIEKERLYLDVNFSLRTLAEKSGLSTHHISQILNEDLKTSFFQLTHSYRIEEAKVRLKEDDNYIKIERLAYDLGYKSKSTFFKAFKNSTGLTPLEYRNS